MPKCELFIVYRKGAEDETERSLCFLSGDAPEAPKRLVLRDYFISAAGEVCRVYPGGGGVMLLTGRCAPCFAPGLLSECRRQGLGAVIIASRPSRGARELAAALCREVKVYAEPGCFAPGCTALLTLPVLGASLRDALAQAAAKFGAAALCHRPSCERFSLPCRALRGVAVSLRELSEAKEKALRCGFSPELCRKYVLSAESLILYDDEESFAAKKQEVLSCGAELIYDSRAQNF